MSSKNNVLGSENGRPVEIHVHRLFQWVMGICAVFITSMFAWGTSEIVSLGRAQSVIESRIGVIENTRFTAEDWIRASSDHITQREYDAAMHAIQNSLERIEEKLDNR